MLQLAFMNWKHTKIYSYCNLGLRYMLQHWFVNDKMYKVNIWLYWKWFEMRSKEKQVRSFSQTTRLLLVASGVAPFCLASLLWFAACCLMVNSLLSPPICWYCRVKLLLFFTKMANSFIFVGICCLWCSFQKTHAASLLWLSNQHSFAHYYPSKVLFISWVYW